MELDAKKPMVMHLIPRPNGIKKGADQRLSILYQLSAPACHISSAPDPHLIISLAVLFSFINPASPHSPFDRRH
jgi:hypothetical protein